MGEIREGRKERLGETMYTPRISMPRQCRVPRLGRINTYGFSVIMSCQKVEPIFSGFSFRAASCFRLFTKMMFHEYSLDCWLNKETLQKPTARENLHCPDQVIRETTDN